MLFIVEWNNELTAIYCTINNTASQIVVWDAMRVLCNTLTDMQASVGCKDVWKQRAISCTFIKTS